MPNGGIRIGEGGKYHVDKVIRGIRCRHECDTLEGAIKFIEQRDAIVKPAEPEYPHGIHKDRFGNYYVDIRINGKRYQKKKIGSVENGLKYIDEITSAFYDFKILQELTINSIRILLELFIKLPGLSSAPGGVIVV